MRCFYLPENCCWRRHDAYAYAYDLVVQSSRSGAKVSYMKYSVYPVTHPKDGTGYWVGGTLNCTYNTLEEAKKASELEYLRVNL